MAKKPTKTPTPLGFAEIVLGADAATIKAAYEARLQIDALLAEREEAYRKIGGLETQIDTLMGEPGLFVFPPPPCPVAGFDTEPAAKPAKGGKKSQATETTSDEDATEGGDEDNATA
jgi:hypothetical protein